MKKYATFVLALNVVVFLGFPSAGNQPSADVIRATRFRQNPLITVATSGSLAGNVNGPAMIRVPGWVQRPLGRYYLYFANHSGDFIRLAYADSVTGPWKVYEPGVLHVRDTAFSRPGAGERSDQYELLRRPPPPGTLANPKEVLANITTHVASPEVFVDTAHKRLVMWFHGWWTNGEPWPKDPAGVVEWARQKGYGQFTQAAVSSDGLNFKTQSAITKTSYLRIFQHRGYFYALSRLGQLSRSTDPLAEFEIGANPFRDGPYANRVRHVALVLRGDQLYVFFTAIGDAPERILVSTIDLTRDWTTWRATNAVDVLTPEAAYECPDLPNAPSEAGDVDVPVRQIRDPFVFEEKNQAFLLYSICGEQGIAGAELSFVVDKR